MTSVLLFSSVFFVLFFFVKLTITGTDLCAVSNYVVYGKLVSGDLEISEVSDVQCGKFLSHVANALVDFSELNVYWIGSRRVLGWRMKDIKNVRCVVWWFYCKVF